MGIRINLHNTFFQSIQKVVAKIFEIRSKYIKRFTIKKKKNLVPCILLFNAKLIKFRGLHIFTL
jgi:hypothetical protein